MKTDSQHEGSLTTYDRFRAYFPTFLPQRKPKKRILMVEDELSIAEMTRMVLRNGGFDVDIAENLDSAHQHLKEKRPDAVLLDIILPDGNGLNLLEEFKKQYPTVPALIFTSKGYNENMMQTARAKGASGFVSKMMGLGSIVSAIRNVLPREA